TSTPFPYTTLFRSEDAGRVRIFGRDPKRGFESRCLVNKLFSFVSVDRFLFSGRSKFWRSRLFVAAEFVNRFGGSFYLFRRNPDETFFLVYQIGHLAAFSVDDSRRLRRSIDPFLVPLNFHGDFAILAGAFNSLNNREIATRGDKQAKGNYRKKSGQVPHASS